MLRLSDIAGRGSRVGKQTRKVDKFSPLSPLERRALTENLIRLSTERRQAPGSSRGGKIERIDPERR